MPSLPRLTLCVLLATLSLSAVAVPGTSGAVASPAQPTTQLPRSASPTHYDIALRPDIANARFSAVATIQLDVLQPTRVLTMNAAGLAFDSASIRSAAAADAVAAGRIITDDERQTVSLHFARPLAPGSYQLRMAYSGSIGDQAAGLFYLDYDNGGRKQRALYTQFENSEARRMFPGWDEPAYKATFTLEVAVPQGQTAVSNMPVQSDSALPEGGHLLRFATTPRMSTYLLFLAAGDFERATVREGGTELGVVTQRGALPQARFALESSRAVLRDYNDYFGLPYPLPKLDNVAAPGRHQFFSAMENWGAIFTFENAILLDPAISTQADRQQALLVAAHQIAHQWFGDLVTMQWWDDLWLNEGFASWMESRTMQRLHPEWHWELNNIGSREAAMDQDALSSTHPVVQHIDTVEQANQAFDSITYQKGEAVIRMLEDYVGSDAWRAGVRAYVARHAYGNTASDDLWRTMEQAAHKPVTAIAHDFTLQTGVPLIRLADAVCRDGATHLTLTQSEFSKDQPEKALAAGGARGATTWRVPVVAQTLGGARVSTVVSGGRASMTLPGCGAVLLNAGQAGYYRSLYTPGALAALSASFAQLPTIDQLGLLADSWALSQAGLQPASAWLDLADRAAPDTAPQVWSRIASVLVEIQQAYRSAARAPGVPQTPSPAQPLAPPLAPPRAEATPQPAGSQAGAQAESQAAWQARFASYARARLAPVLARLGWDGPADEAAQDANQRAELIGALSALNDPGLIAEARRRFASGQMPPALRRAILGVVADHADAADWDRLHAMARAETSAMTRSDLYDLLGASDDPALAQRALQLALTEEPGATSSATLISRVAVKHPDQAFDFALAHRTEVEAKVDATSRSRYFPQLGSLSADPAMVAKLQAYGRAYLPPENRGEVYAAVAAVQYRVKNGAARLPEVSAWLAAHQR